MTQLIVQGTFDPSKNQLIFNFGNIPPHSVLLSQQSNNQDAEEFPVLQQPTFIQKHGLRFGSSALGLAGGVGLLVSCIWSVLLPAIGSIGVIGIACLVNRKITPLHTKELSSEAAKSQSLFEQQIRSKAVSGSLLDEPAVGADNLPAPMFPMYNATNQLNIPLPMLGSGSLLDEPTVADNLPPPMSPIYNATNQPNILPPLPLPSAPLMPLTTPLLPKQKKECPKIDSSCIDSKKPGTSADPKEALLSSIRNSFNFMQIKELLKQNPEKYPSNLLLRELKTTYVRALAIGESKLLGTTYFKDKIDSFEKNFAIVEQEENQTTEEMEDICKKTSDFNSLLKNMQWAKSLLEVLSGREDISDKTRERCSEKLKSIDKHIDKLQRRNKKKPEEASGSNPQDISSSHDREATSISTQEEIGSSSHDVASILARRVVMEYSDSSSSSEGESDDKDKWSS